MEEQIVGASGELIGFLATSRGRWTVESLSKFNRYVANLNDLVEREQAMQKASLAQADQNLKELEQY
jgi:hypothetical protein